MLCVSYVACYSTGTMGVFVRKMHLSYVCMIVISVDIISLV